MSVATISPTPLDAHLLSALFQIGVAYATGIVLALTICWCASVLSVIQMTC